MGIAVTFWMAFLHFDPQFEKVHFCKWRADLVDSKPTCIFSCYSSAFSSLLLHSKGCHLSMARKNDPPWKCWMTTHAIWSVDRYLNWCLKIWFSACLSSHFPSRRSSGLLFSICFAFRDCIVLKLVELFVSGSLCTVPSPVKATVLGRGVKGFHGSEGPLHSHPFQTIPPAASVRELEAGAILAQAGSHIRRPCWAN